MVNSAKSICLNDSDLTIKEVAGNEELQCSRFASISSHLHISSTIAMGT